MKRFIALILCFCLILSFAGCTTNNETPDESDTPIQEQIDQEEGVNVFIPGTYEGAAQGMYGIITVEITVDEESITKVDVLEQKDTRKLAEAAVEGMPLKIVENQSLAVDAVSGATFTSLGILTASKNALTDAGFDITDFNQRPEEKALADGSTEEYDIVIVGGGTAGLGAAIEIGRINSDASVLVLEKLAYTGGSGSLSGSMIVAGGTTWNEKEENVDYTTEEFVDFFKLRASEQDRMPEGMWINEELVAAVGDKSTEYFQYLIDRDVPLNDKMMFASAQWAEGRGIAGFVNEKKYTKEDPEAAQIVYNEWFTEIASESANIRTNSEVVELVIGDGAVEGVVVEDKVNNERYTVNAKKVILACGGISSNTELFRELNSDVANIDKVFNYSVSGNTGDFFTLTDNLDVATTGYGFIAYPGLNQQMGFHTPIGKVSASGFSFWVNNSAERFTNEKGYYYQAGFRILEQDEAEVYGLADKNHSSAKVLEEAVEAGYAFKADTIEELAEKIEVDVETLKSTVEKYNSDYTNGEDTLFGQNVAQMTPILEAPYYAMPVRVSTLGSMASLKVDEKCQILDTEGNPIPNLYGGGEVVFGNMFVQEYVSSGCAVGTAVYTGAIAAFEAANSLE